MRFAEQLESEVSQLLCLEKFFDGRLLKKGYTWNSTICEKLEEFLQEKSLLSKIRKEDCRLFLDCHASIAFYAGYQLDLKSGVRLFPVQKGVSGQEVWKPDGTTEADWVVSNKTTSRKSNDVALCLSVTRDVVNDVQRYLENSSINVGKIYNFLLPGGSSSQTVRSPKHGLALADKLSNKIRELRAGQCGRVVHTVPSCTKCSLVFSWQTW